MLHGQCRPAGCSVITQGSRMTEPHLGSTFKITAIGDDKEVTLASTFNVFNGKSLMSLLSTSLIGQSKSSMFQPRFRVVEKCNHPILLGEPDIVDEWYPNNPSAWTV